MAAAQEKKGADIVLLKVNEVSYLADYFVIITGFSQTQLKAIAQSIEDQVEEKFDTIRDYVVNDFNSKCNID